MNVLNSPPEGNGDESMEAEELSRGLQKVMLQLKAEHMGPEGRGVDYPQLASSKLFSEYVQIASQLVNCNPAQLSEESRMAFFISILNIPMPLVTVLSLKLPSLPNLRYL